MEQVRGEGYPAREEDVIYRSPFARKHLNVHRHYSFLLPDMPGGRPEEAAVAHLPTCPPTSDDAGSQSFLL